jgi:uncharacterized protein YqeY
MRRALTAAMKSRDRPAVTALRSALAAIDNAEAVDIAATPQAAGGPAPSAEAQPGEGRAASVEAQPGEERPASVDAQPGEGHAARVDTEPGEGRSASAEDPSAGQREPTVAGRIAGAAVGLGAAEVERRTLTPAETQAIVRGEVAERQTAAHAYERAGRPGHAERLRAEAEVLGAFLDEPVDDPVDPDA